jgi:hypothetical protein
MLGESVLDDGPFQVGENELVYRHCHIALLLGTWGKPEAAPAIRQALRTCWKIEQQPGSTGRPCDRVDRFESWHYYQDHMAYALGQLGAWGVASNLGLPETHVRVVTIYMTLNKTVKPLRETL